MSFKKISALLLVCWLLGGWQPARAAYTESSFPAWPFDLEVVDIGVDYLQPEYVCGTQTCDTANRYAMNNVTRPGRHFYAIVKFNGGIFTGANYGGSKIAVNFECDKYGCINDFTKTGQGYTNVRTSYVYTVGEFFRVSGPSLKDALNGTYQVTAWLDNGAISKKEKITKTITLDNQSLCGNGVLDVGEVCDGGYTEQKACAISSRGWFRSCADNCSKSVNQCYRESICDDSDGIDPLIKGKITGRLRSGDNFDWEDQCVQEGDRYYVKEYYCKNKAYNGLGNQFESLRDNLPNILKASCAYGCADGKCLPAPTPPPSVTPTTTPTTTPVAPQVTQPDNQPTAPNNSDTAKNNPPQAAEVNQPVEQSEAYRENQSPKSSEDSPNVKQNPSTTSTGQNSERNTIIPGVALWNTNKTKVTLKINRDISDKERRTIEGSKKYLRFSNPQLVNALKGKLILQTESNGEVWYIHPVSGERFYIENGTAAYEILNAMGQGIKTSDLEKIPLGYNDKLAAGLTDSDSDGLPDVLEQAIGSDPQKTDSDADGFHDLTELTGGYRLNSNQAYKIDRSLAGRLRGIYLDVDNRGAAWYIKDGYRYYVSPLNAYNVMKYLSLGVANGNINQVPIGAIAD